jgi:hypothetical protein
VRLRRVRSGPSAAEPCFAGSTLRLAGSWHHCRQSRPA